MLEFDPATGLLALPVWMTAAVAALVVVLAVFAVARAGAVRTVVSLAVLGALGYAGWLAWLVTERAGGFGATAGGGDRVEERRLFEARVNELLGRATMPGSPLACLEGAAGDQVAEGCERLIFGSPDTIAASVSYLSTRLALVSEGYELAAASGLNYDKQLATLRRGLEADRYGIVAYLLLQNPDCKAERCEALAMMRDPNKIRVNLLEKPFDVLVARYSANWQSGARNVAATESRGVIAAAPPPPATSGQGVPVSSKYDFPSAASIPPVSIMNAEPGSPPQGSAAAPVPAARSVPAPAAKRAPPKPAPRHEAAAPTPLAPTAPAAVEERTATQRQ